MSVPNGAAGATDTTAAAAAATTTAAAATGTPDAAAAAAAATPTTDGQAGAGAGTATGNEGKSPEQIAADAAAATAAAAPQGAPEQYELALPEGGHLDESDLAAFIADAKANGLTNEAAQAVLNREAERLAAQSARFLQETQAHPEIGGAHLEAAQLHANKALDRFLPPTSAEGQALRSLLAKTGYANHPAFVLAFARIGKAMGEDQPVVPPTAPAPARRSAADVLFGDAK